MLTKSSDIVIVSALRTPFGLRGGFLSEINSVDLGAIPMRELLNRVNLPPETVGEVFWGVGAGSVCHEPLFPRRRPPIPA